MSTPPQTSGPGTPPPAPGPGTPPPVTGASPRRVRRRWLVILLVAGLGLGTGLVAVADSAGGPAALLRGHASTAPGTVEGSKVGSPGIGDPYFPASGNGGYDVRHYQLEIRYNPTGPRFVGHAVLTVVASQALARFDLDFGRLEITALTVNHERAAWHRAGHREAGSGGAGSQELVVTPARVLPAGAEFTVDVRYDSGLTLGEALRTMPAGVVVVGEPDAATDWFPCNDHPRDKATYDFAITAPDGYTAVANGVPLGSEPAGGGWRTWRWRESHPMATYLATMAVGKFRVVTDEVVAGLPVYSVVDASVPAGRADALLAWTPKIIEFFAGLFGPYPFDAAGGIIANAPGMPGALEVQTRPVYPAGFIERGTSIEESTWLVAHELAHEWFGDSVSVYRWRDIWLNEGFATYAQWLWAEHLQAYPVARSFDTAYQRVDWEVRIGDPGPERLFHPAVYERGAMTLHALRLAVGDEVFFRILREWATSHKYGNGTTQEFIALADQMAGRSLGSLFDAWLSGSARPPM